jgi:sigma-B regulation protein RsbU (phosphoserine phosphatase)
LRGFVAACDLEVLEAENGPEALRLCRAQRIDIVLSDWRMPGMSGPELCGALRARDPGHYCYFILLTAHDEQATAALDSGADDFLAKPVDPAELRARMRAGLRILEVEERLRERNRVVSQSLSRIKDLNTLLQRDLEAARRLQHSMVPERDMRMNNTRISLMLQSCGQVGGDLIGSYPIDRRRIGVFALDVAGHGVASALVTARLSGVLSGPRDRSPAFRWSRGRHVPRPPEETVALLNEGALKRLTSEHYFTLILAEVDTATGRVAFCQAGHPRPILLRADGGTECRGSSGFPVGLLPEATYERHELTLQPGDRLFMASDGLSDARGPEGRTLGQEGIMRMLRSHRDHSGVPMLDRMLAEVREGTGPQPCEDDISAVLIEFARAPPERIEV